jgi:DNA (cytosine-5)-methyltransferase 1
VRRASWLFPRRALGLITINLCAGAGGLAIGLRKAGFENIEMFEKESHACETLRTNRASDRPTLAGNVHEEDVTAFDWTSVREPVGLLASAVPCQPFSLAGKHLAYEDGRNTFPALFRAIRKLMPAAVFVENVRGLLRTDFQAYFEYILRQLECPSITPRKHELWQDHNSRIRRYQCSTRYIPEYRVVWRLLNAADFGVPQLRYRVFIVATRMELPPYGFPSATHSQAALVQDQESGDYWSARQIPPKPVFHRNGVGPSDARTSAWITVRDSIGDLPEPAAVEALATMNHWLIPGARSYAGHTGSQLDWPAKAIKAGVHGVPGGENTVVDDSGETRYFTMREAARIQNFPDNHLFTGARLHVMRQVGNAVPCALAAAVARPLYEIIEDHGKTT